MKRLTARVRHRRRQQHSNLPPSGLGGISAMVEQIAAPQHSVDYRTREKAMAEGWRPRT